MQKKKTVTIILGTVGLVLLVLVKCTKFACRTSGRLMRGEKK